MPNRVNQYYVGDTVTFRGSFKIAGVAQTPDAGGATAKVMEYKESGSSEKKAATSATISGKQLQYKYAGLLVGRYALFFYASYNSGADTRTGVIEFVVKERQAH